MTAPTQDTVSILYAEWHGWLLREGPECMHAGDFRWPLWWLVTHRPGDTMAAMAYLRRLGSCGCRAFALLDDFFVGEGPAGRA